MNPSHQGNFVPSQNFTSSQSSSRAYDKELWDLYVSAVPSFSTVPEAERYWKVQKVLMIAGGHRSEAIRYLENLRQLSLNPNPIQIGFQCPRENVFCKAVEFDNIKVFYHRTYPDPSQMDIWNFYIGRPGTSASQCIDWAKEGIKVEVCGPTGKWGITTALVVPPSTRVRIMYNFKGMRRTHELIFPSNYTSVPTTYLEPM